MDGSLGSSLPANTSDQACADESKVPGGTVQLDSGFVLGLWQI